ncbi:hypothetical protein [Paenibacillus sp. FSL L8-0696]|uniref:hypothetical protein n=1 Tax=unclassified Paenibacillus TaxID=185978 RepID=UPI0031192C90
MLTIFCTSDIVHLHEKLPLTLTTAVSHELFQLCKLLNSGENDTDFGLNTIGYTIAFLEHHEPLSSLKTLELTYPFLHVEYVELHELPEVQYYRILLMYDNESFTTVFSVKGTQNTKLEEWLADQAIPGEVEDQ